jgi:magnesium-transporting ATPase (P-type)
MPAHSVKTELPFWQLSVTALMERLNSNPGGLSRAEAAARLIHFGPNLIHAERKRALLLQFLAKFRNPLVIILLTASALSAFTGDAISFFIISAIVVSSVTLDFVQEHRAGQAAERLRKSVAVCGQVLRVSISVDSAVDVAKAAADMILLERDLGVLHAGVIEGRRTFDNIMKYIMMGTSSNFGNMFSMAGASLFLPFLPMLPVQILLNNLLYDASELPIPLDRVDDDYLSRPNPWLIACSLTVVAVAVLLPFTPAGVYLGFVAPPAFFFLILILMLVAYLLAVEGMKQWFFRQFAVE